VSTLSMSVPVLGRDHIHPPSDLGSPSQPEGPSAARDGLRRIVHARLRTGPGVLLYGPAGIGKSSALDALAADSGAQGIRILRCAPAESERRLPFAGLIDLLTGIPDETFTRLPGGLGAALRSAVLRGTLPKSDQEHLHVRMAVLHLLRLLSTGSPVWLVVDDAQWLDRPTGEVLAFVARRAAGATPRILAAERVSGPGAPSFAVADGIALAQVEVPAPSPGELGAIIARRRGLDLPAATVRLIHRTCGGNPGYALELAGALPPGPHPGWAQSSEAQSSGAQPSWARSAGAQSAESESMGAASIGADSIGAESIGAHEPLPIPARLRESLLRRPRELPAPTRLLLLAASAARRPTVALLAEACADERAGAHLAAAEQLGVVRIDPAGLVGFEHPLIRAAIYADASADERSAVHAGLAGAVTETAERARHLALADPRRAEPLARQLAEAAASAGRRGAPRLAAELADLAARRTPGGAAHTRSERLLAAARHAWDAGLLADARRFADQVLDGAASIAQRTAARIILLRCSGQALGAAGPLIAHGLTESVGQPALQARLWSWSAAAELTAGNSGESLRHARKASDCARRAGDVAAEIGALSKLAHVYALTGDAQGEAVLRRALDLVEREVARGAAPRSAFWEPLRRQAVFDLQAGRLGEAEQRLADLARQLGETFEHEGLCTVLVTLTDVRVRAGNCRAALDSARWALRVSQDLGAAPAPILFAAALAESAGGSVAQALRYAEEGVRTARADGDLHGLLRTLGALGAALLQSGAADRAAAALREADLIERRVGIADPSSGNWHAEYVEALVAIGQVAEAAAVLSRIGGHARDLGRHRAVTALDRGRALRAAALGRTAEAAAELRRVAGLQTEQPIERMRTLIHLAAVERRRGRPERARTVLAEARRTAVAAGAAPWIAKVDAERDQRAARAPRPVSGLNSGPDSSANPGSDSGPDSGPASSSISALEPKLDLGSWPGPDLSPGLRPGLRPDQELTRAEERCARLAARGATNREIAEALHLSVKTVEGTLSRSYRKLGVRSRTQLARLAGSGDAHRAAGESVPGFG
jgi:DNA-binding CsgD family transcriptional regulator/tetratricopeptide (TPR) repeat protein